jgi:hypothetical protein
MTPRLSDATPKTDSRITKISRPLSTYCSLRLCFHNNHFSWALAQRKITATNQDHKKKQDSLPLYTFAILLPSSVLIIHAPHSSPQIKKKKPNTPKNLFTSPRFSTKLPFSYSAALLPKNHQLSRPH